MTWRQTFQPLAGAARSFLGINGISAKVDAMRLELQAALREREAPAPAPSPPPEPPANHRLVGVTLPGGASYRLSISVGEGDIYHDAVASEAAYDPNWHFLNAWIRPGEVFLDLGANIGTISIPAAVRGAQVHSFELLDANVRHLVRSVEANGLANIAITVGAVSDCADYVGISGVSAWGSVVEGALVSIPTIVVDTYVERRRLGAVHVMKLDVEGSEKRALEGAAGLLARDHPDILIECNAWSCGNYGYSFRDLLRMLEALGYRLFRLLDGRFCPATAEAPQELFFTDYLATTKTPEEIAARSGWAPSRLETADMVANIVDNERYGDMHKMYVLSARPTLPAAVLADRRVAAALRDWQALENPAVAAILQTGSA